MTQYRATEDPLYPESSAILSTGLLDEQEVALWIGCSSQLSFFAPET